MRLDLGSLLPFRELLEDLERAIAHDAERRPEDDPAVLANRATKKRLEEALRAAENVELEIDARELARKEGVTPAAIYKRHERGQIVGRKRGGRLTFPVRGEINGAA